MSGQLSDYYVTYRREEAIANAAVLCRRLDRSETSPFFNVVRFVEDVLQPSLKRKGVPLRIKLFDAKNGAAPGFVTVGPPLTLNMDAETWDWAGRGDPLSRLVVGHEVGHIVLHGHYPKAAFSTNEAARLKAIPQGNSAEWQACVFADHFLVPTRVARVFSSAWEIVTSCGVQREVAERRLTDEERLRRELGVSCCSTCGLFDCRETH